MVNIVFISYYILSYFFLLLDLVCFICVVVGCKYFLNGRYCAEGNGHFETIIEDSSNTLVLVCFTI